MSETASTAAPDAGAATQRAAEQARLRKERREAKIRAGGAERLSKITGAPVESTPAPPPPRQPQAAVRRLPASAPQQHPDPDEVDISLQHAAAPRVRAPVREAGRPGGRARQLATAVHIAAAAGLGAYVVVAGGWTGRRAERERAAAGVQVVAGSGAGPGADAAGVSRQAFWVFAAAEAALLAGDLLVGGPVMGEDGWVGGVLRSGLVPDAWQMRLEVALRYGRFFRTVRRDLLVCVFVLGLCAWLRPG